MKMSGGGVVAELKNRADNLFLQLRINLEG